MIMFLMIMKLYMRFMLLMVVTLLFASCSRIEKTRDYRLASDGLFYDTHSRELYSGTISDSTNMIMHYEVVDGKKNGTFLVYYPDGTLAQQGYLIDNKNVGEWKYYYANGSLETKGMFINDIPQGEWVFYYPDGVLKSIGSFKDGLRHGPWYQYEENGDLKLIYFFRHGKFVEIQNKKA
jgi:antitoxin component YwqK of YwqJK toxin-antitoxin module